jgi:hypothetical protein
MPQAVDVPLETGGLGRSYGRLEALTGLSRPSRPANAWR